MQPRGQIDFRCAAIKVIKILILNGSRKPIADGQISGKRSFKSSAWVLQVSGSGALLGFIAQRPESDANGDDYRVTHT